MKDSRAVLLTAIYLASGDLGRLNVRCFYFRLFYGNSD